jgi:predicted kinase
MTKRLPTLVVVCGPAGTGKTTLAHRLAAELTCPAICRDEIKEGMTRTAVDYVPEIDDELAHRTLAAFFDVLRLLIERGVSIVAEAAFQDHVWKPNLAPVVTLAELRVVQCGADPAIAHRRLADRAATRRAHADATLLAALARGDDYFTGFRPLMTDAPTIAVDTSDGYRPTLEEVVAFIEA